MRRLPHDARDDVARELRATIEDTIDARPDGVTPTAAERQAIAELGDPERLASGYSGRPQYLIGPAFYPLYLRVIKIVPPVIAFIVAGVVLLGLAIEGEASAGRVVRDVWLAIPMVLLQVCFWTTLGFAIAERLGAEPNAGRRFDPDALAEEPPARQIGFVDSSSPWSSSWRSWHCSSSGPTSCSGRATEPRWFCSARSPQRSTPA